MTDRHTFHAHDDGPSGNPQPDDMAAIPLGGNWHDDDAEYLEEILQPVSDEALPPVKDHGGKIEEPKPAIRKILVPGVFTLTGPTGAGAASIPVKVLNYNPNRTHVTVTYTGNVRIASDQGMVKQGTALPHLLATEGTIDLWDFNGDLWAECPTTDATATFQTLSTVEIPVTSKHTK